ncbi:hypothetical protein HN51_059718 [Arachis hypogaea]
MTNKPDESLRMRNDRTKVKEVSSEVSKYTHWNQMTRDLIMNHLQIYLASCPWFLK